MLDQELEFAIRDSEHHTSRLLAYAEGPEALAENEWREAMEARQVALRGVERLAESASAEDLRELICRLERVRAAGDRAICRLRDLRHEAVLEWAMLSRVLGTLSSPEADGAEHLEVSA